MVDLRSLLISNFVPSQGFKLFQTLYLVHRTGFKADFKFPKLFLARYSGISKKILPHRVGMLFVIYI